MVVEVSNGPASTEKGRIRRWNDPAYKSFVAVCAEARGWSINALYKKSGLDQSSHYTDASKNGRSIGPILAIANTLEMDPLLFVAAGIGGHSQVKHNSAELAKLALISNVTSHLYAVLAPACLSPDDGSKLLATILAAIKKND